ncbi:hypothetical protein K470DRAFT_263199 [Piedraia hortae CBS 480.64]|uniref:Uncharacterized protein n=1 Tax=Piedraia hortae CBS 480.64 TaxID=1314780 RepID=A0A6A7C3C4_9PEZI|nr:hypothetical protein K470DRAFT_263199 [Piedraia hortae CBS 480.64]
MTLPTSESFCWLDSDYSKYFFLPRSQTLPSQPSFFFQSPSLTCIDLYTRTAKVCEHLREHRPSPVFDLRLLFGTGPPRDYCPSAKILQGATVYTCPSFQRAIYLVLGAVFLRRAGVTSNIKSRHGFISTKMHSSTRAKNASRQVTRVKNRPPQASPRAKRHRGEKIKSAIQKSINSRNSYNKSNRSRDMEGVKLPSCSLEPSACAQQMWEWLENPQAAADPCFMKAQYEYVDPHWLDSEAPVVTAPSSGLLYDAQDQKKAQFQRAEFLTMQGSIDPQVLARQREYAGKDQKLHYAKNMASKGIPEIYITPPTPKIGPKRDPYFLSTINLGTASFPYNLKKNEHLKSTAYDSVSPDKQFQLKYSCVRCNLQGSLPPGVTADSTQNLYCDKCGGYVDCQVITYKPLRRKIPIHRLRGSERERPAKRCKLYQFTDHLTVPGAEGSEKLRKLSDGKGEMVWGGDYVPADPERRLDGMLVADLMGRTKAG